MNARLNVRSRCTKDPVAGITSSIEFVMAFVEWADSVGPRLTWELIRDKWGCHRSTAYRWLDAYSAVKSKRAA